VLCQEDHMMTGPCVSLNLVCKGCGNGNRGHVRKYCTQQSNQLTEDQKNQIIQECVEDRVSPLVLAKKWKCSDTSIRVWVRKAGKQLPVKYKTRVFEYIRDNNVDVSDDTITTKLTKRKCSNQDPSLPHHVAKMAELMTKDDSNSALSLRMSSPEKESEPNHQITVCDTVNSLQNVFTPEKNVNSHDDIVFKSGDKESNPSGNNDHSKVSDTMDYKQQTLANQEEYVETNGEFINIFEHSEDIKSEKDDVKINGEYMENFEDIKPIVNYVKTYGEHTEPSEDTKPTITHVKINGKYMKNFGSCEDMNPTVKILRMRPSLYMDLPSSKRYLNNDNANVDKELQKREKVKFTCNIRGNQFNLKIHQKTVHNNGGKRFKCKECDYAAAQKVTVIKHMQSIHKGIILPCDSCSKVYKWQGDLTRHKQRAHAGIKFKCSICNKEFAEKRCLKIHNQSVHLKKKFECGICRLEVGSKGYLGIHMRAVHEGKQFECDECDVKTARKSDLSRHIKFVHKGVKDLKCVKCGYVTGRIDYLKKHIISVHGEKFSEGVTWVRVPQCLP